jgi:hypothetical protein
MTFCWNELTGIIAGAELLRTFLHASTSGAY